MRLLSLIFSRFGAYFPNLHSLPSKKVLLKDNRPLTEFEFKKVSDICDIFKAISDAAGLDIIMPPVGGVFWDKAKPLMSPFDLFNRKNRCEINHMLLLFNAFRDFCALAYEYDHYTPKPDYWVRRYKRLSSVVPREWRAALPPRFGEIGWAVDGMPINRWSSVNQERINAMYVAGICRYLQTFNVPRILEIGGGAGEIAYTLSNALPGFVWYDVDLIGCLIYSAIQLSVNLPQKKHLIYIGNLDLPSTLNSEYIVKCPKAASAVTNANVYIPNFLIDDFKSKLDVQLAYNTYSFGEMPSSAVNHYAEILSEFLKKDGLLFEQNGYFPERGGDDPEVIISKYFSKVKLPDKLDGKWLPNGPIRLWDNNGVLEHVKKCVDDYEVNRLIEGFKDKTDKCDISYPNEKLWPEVYNMIKVHQNVKELYPW